MNKWQEDIWVKNSSIKSNGGWRRNFYIEPIRLQLQRATANTSNYRFRIYLHKYVIQENRICCESEELAQIEAVKLYQAFLENQLDVTVDYLLNNENL